MKPIAVLTTAGSLEEARTIARALVERKLAACAQISEIESFYHWSGAVQNDKEYRLLVKTTQEMYGAVERSIRELHSYELPAIFSIAVDEAYVPYAEWIADHSRGPSPGRTPLNSG
jgi:periplasmic divalent cation tolerance protein